VSLAKDCPRIRTALGFHPQIAHERFGELPLFDALLPETRYVGEIGLDGAPEFRVHWREQIKAFEQILRATAKAGGRIMSIHSRHAADEVLDALAATPNAGVPVLHWFSGNKAQLTRAINMGCWFSVGPAMLRSKRGRELVAAMPRDRVLTETDGPFAMVGDIPLLPADVNSAVTQLANIWSESPHDAEQRINKAFRSLVML
jgi:TatD DNase family protein